MIIVGKGKFKFTFFSYRGTNYAFFETCNSKLTVAYSKSITQLGATVEFFAIIRSVKVDIYIIAFLNNPFLYRISKLFTEYVVIVLAIYFFIIIRFSANGFGKITIAPKLPESVSELKCTLHSVRGPISVYVRKISGKYHIDAVIPPNCTATLITPDGEEKFLGNGKFIMN